MTALPGRWSVRCRHLALSAVLGIMTIDPALGSVNLPLHHWTYEAIERLVALGVIDRAMVVAKPYSRKQAAKYVARAIERIQADRVPADGREVIAAPLVERLKLFLQSDLVELGAISVRQQAAGEKQETRVVTRVGGRLQVEGDAFSIGQGNRRLRENRMGQYYADGGQVQTDFRAWLEVTDVLALSVDPKYISNRDALGNGIAENDENVYLQELNVKLTFFNIAVQVGRSTNWWGPGYRGSLLLTDHAFPLDMVQIGSDEPFRLPWVFRSLGDWTVNTFWTQLERERDFPHAQVFGLRLGNMPADWLEWGFTRLTQFDGDGRDQSFPDAVFDAYTNDANQGGDLEVNEQAMLDFRVRIPRVPYLIPFPAGVQLYGELGSEDKWSKIIPSRGAFLVGIYIPQLINGDTLDLRIEYADTDFSRRNSGIAQVWYNNGTYVSGMRHKGFPLGHWMGTDAIDLFVRSTRYMTKSLRLGANFELSERDRSQPAPEEKLEAGVDLTWHLTRDTQLSFAYTYQRIENPGLISSVNPFVETFQAGVTSHNHFLWTNLSVEF